MAEGAWPLGAALAVPPGPFPDPAEVAARFSLALRARGVPVPLDRATWLVAALALLAPLDRERLYWAARLTLVTGRRHLAAFDAVFAALFGGGGGGRPEPPERPTPERVPTPAARRPSPPLAGLLGAAAEYGRASASWRDHPDRDPPTRRIGVAAIASSEEALATKDFAALDEEEAAAARRLVAALEVTTPRRLVRRRVPALGGPRVDLRATLRASLRTGGDPLFLARRKASVRPRPLVLLADVSGSMEPYTRAYLQFFHRAVVSSVRAEAFVFATRLTRLTPVLRAADADAALAAAGSRAPDWSGGTRIGAALAEFNDAYGRRGLARGAVVVIFSDGWERDDPAVLRQEMARLRRLAFRVVWVNPRQAAPGYAPLAGGMAAALPQVDFFVSGHTVAAMAEVIAAIGGSGDRGGGGP